MSDHHPTHHRLTSRTLLALLLLCLLVSAGAACTTTGGASGHNRYDIPDNDLETLNNIPPKQRQLRALKILRRAQTAMINDDRVVAQQLYLEALQVYESLKDLSAQAAIHNDLGLLHKQAGELRQAKQLLEKALELSKQGDEPTVTAEAFFNLAGVHYASGDDSGAEYLFSEAIKTAQAIPNPELASLAYSGRGNTRRRTNNLAPAIDDYTQALKGWNQLGRNNLAAVTHMNLAYALILKGDSASAAEHLQQGIDAFGSKPSADRAILLPHLTQLLQLTRKDPQEARTKVLKLLGRGPS